MTQIDKSILDRQSLSKVYIVIRSVPYEECDNPVQGVYGDRIDAECHRDTLIANEHYDVEYYVEEHPIWEWEGGQ